MEKYIDPISDVGFKLLFGRESISEPVLIDLLNALLGHRDDSDRITSISYRNNERGADWKDGKGIRYDIHCETAAGHRFIVEMQKASQPKFTDRATFYVARGFTEQGYKGKDEDDIGWDYSLKPVIGVFICNFHVKGLDPEPVIRASVLDEKSLKPIGIKSRYIFIQLPFFRKEEWECTDIEDQWIYNIKNMGIRQEVAFMNNSEIFKRLAQVANVATLTPAERWSYDADVKNARDTLNQIRGAYQDGEEKGRAEGRAEGRVETKLEIARSMLSDGISPQKIAKFTGLSIEDIESLEH